MPLPEPPVTGLDPLLIRLVVEAEHERLNDEVYEGQLPPLPPVVVEPDMARDGRVVWTLDERGRPQLLALHVSARLSNVEDVLAVARHELAHLVCIGHFADATHSSTWKVNALLCGADTARCAR